MRNRVEAEQLGADYPDTDTDQQEHTRGIEPLCMWGTAHFIFGNILFLIVCTYGCVWACGCVSTDVGGGQKRALDPMKLEFLAAEPCPM